jgi:integrase/recombinase XerC
MSEAPAHADSEYAADSRSAKTISEFVTLYLSEYARHHSIDTVRAYKSALLRMTRWFGPDCPLTTLTTERILAYYAHLTASKEAGGPGYDVNSIQPLWQSFRSFCTWLHEESYLEANPMPKIKHQRPEKRVQPRAPSSVVVACLYACDKIEDPYQRSLHRAVLYLLHTGAMRRRELVDLRMGDIDLATGIATIARGKGGNGREIVLPDVALVALRDYLTLRAERLPHCQHNYLLAQNNVWRVGIDGLYSLVKRVAALANLPSYKTILPHACRRAWATNSMSAGLPLQEIADQLGHTDLKVTQVYVGSNRDSRLAHRNVYAPGAPQPPTPPPQAPPALSVDELRSTLRSPDPPAPPRSPWRTEGIVQRKPPPSKPRRIWRKEP